ncbi:MAG: hypothetical protein IKL70_03115 [Oscillospiraceae bacterium]|nr:hypothetical protein [Oscillospiraceae bacterium]
MFERFSNWLFESFPILSEQPIMSAFIIMAIIVAVSILLDVISKSIAKKRNQKINK